MSNNTGLGRGLGSLIPNKNIKVSNSGAKQGEGKAPGSSASGKRVLEVEVNKILANPRQPRSNFNEQGINDLVESIKEHGIIQPLIATEKKNGGYELIAGERRLRAARAAGLETVPVIIRDAGEQQKLEMALIENIQREDLNAIELAGAYRELINEFNLTQEELAKRLGKARPTVANTLRLLNLPEDIQAALIERKITFAHAKYLLGLDSEEKLMIMFRKIIHNNLNINDTNKEVRRMGGTKEARIKINYADKDKEFALREFFGTRAEIKRKGRGGQIIIDFFSDDELDGIISKVK